MNLAHSLPRPWTSRRRGECAFPVLGEGENVLSCCRPAGESGYCAGHRKRMKGPPALGYEALLIDLARFIR